MINVGITGQNGFVGQHLYNTLKLFPGEFNIISYQKDLFNDPVELACFVSKCDVIVHLAALNRHNDPEVIYKTNVNLVEKLIAALELTNSKPHVLFSSSLQEERDNLYGKSKKVGRELLSQWAANSGGSFTGLVIPNVFGPFGNPYYNSFIATFSYQLTHNEQPVIDVDGSVKLIFVADLIKIILDKIRKPSPDPLFSVPFTDESRVSDILALLESYKRQYFDSGVIPELKNSFEINLFNTFRSYIDIKSHFPCSFIKHTDQRGAFVEVIRLNIGGQVSFSTTMPGITRGNHFHTRKIERFAVIRGEALIQLRKINTDEVIDLHLSGAEPSYVDMPIWFTHNITNIGQEELYTIFWINEFFDPQDPDTYLETV